VKKSIPLHLATIVDGIARDYAKTIVNGGNNEPLTITADDLCCKVLERIFAQGDNLEDNKELVEKIETSRVKFSGKSFTIQPDMVVTDPQKIEREDKLSIEGDQLHLRGEKLNKDEIMRLASRQEWPEGVKFIAIDDINKLDDNNYEFLLEEEREDIEELQKIVADGQGNPLYVLFIATSSHSQNSDGRMQEGYGHWFTMILNQDEIIIADSTNIVRFDKWARAVLGAIKGNQVANNFTCSDEESKEIRRGIEYLIEKRKRMVFEDDEIIETESRLATLVDRDQTWGNREQLPQDIEEKLIALQQG